MLNIDEINNTIEKLENEDTTYANCSKLASLYIVRDHISNNDVIIKEYNDILPSYNMYVNAKKDYQLHKVNITYVENALNTLCSEILDFLDILYSSCENAQEQDLIVSVVKEFKKTH